jgi:hypothetical protein
MRVLVGEADRPGYRIRVWVAWMLPREPRCERWPGKAQGQKSIRSASERLKASPPPAGSRYQNWK